MALEHTILREGEWKHPKAPGGVLRIDAARLESLRRNFDAGVGLAKDAIPFHVGHTEHVDDRAAAWAPQVAVVDDPDRPGKRKMVALAQYTNEADFEKVRSHQYAFVSPTIDFGYTDKETGERHEAVLRNVALTNYPYLKKMGHAKVVNLSELAQDEGDAATLALAGGMGYDATAANGDPNMDGLPKDYDVRDLPKQCVACARLGNDCPFAAGAAADDLALKQAAAGSGNCPQYVEADGNLPGGGGGPDAAIASPSQNRASPQGRMAMSEDMGDQLPDSMLGPVDYAAPRPALGLVHHDVIAAMGAASEGKPRSGHNGRRGAPVALAHLRAQVPEMGLSHVKDLIGHGIVAPVNGKGWDAYPAQSGFRWGEGEDQVGPTHPGVPPTHLALTPKGRSWADGTGNPAGFHDPKSGPPDPFWYRNVPPEEMPGYVAPKVTKGKRAQMSENAMTGGALSAKHLHLLRAVKEGNTHQGKIANGVSHRDLVKDPGYDHSVMNDLVDSKHVRLGFVNRNSQIPGHDPQDALRVYMTPKGQDALGKGGKAQMSDRNENGSKHMAKLSDAQIERLQQQIDQSRAEAQDAFLVALAEDHKMPADVLKSVKALFDSGQRNSVALAESLDDARVALSEAESDVDLDEATAKVDLSDSVLLDRETVREALLAVAGATRTALAEGDTREVSGRPRKRPASASANGNPASSELVALSEDVSTLEPDAAVARVREWEKAHG